MASFAETIEQRRASIAAQEKTPVQQNFGLSGRQTAQDAFRRRQLIDFLDEVVEFAHSDGHPDARWNFFMETHTIAAFEVDPVSKAGHVIDISGGRPVAQLQWSERMHVRTVKVGFRLTLVQPDYDRLMVGIGTNDGEFVTVGDEHLNEVVAARYDGAAELPNSLTFLVGF